MLELTGSSKMLSFKGEPITFIRLQTNNLPHSYSKIKEALEGKEAILDGVHGRIVKVDMHSTMDEYYHTHVAVVFKEN